MFCYHVAEVNAFLKLVTEQLKMHTTGFHSEVVQLSLVQTEFHAANTEGDFYQSGLKK